MLSIIKPYKSRSNLIASEKLIFSNTAMHHHTGVCCTAHIPKIYEFISYIQRPREQPYHIYLLYLWGCAAHAAHGIKTKNFGSIVKI